MRDFILSIFLLGIVLLNANETPIVSNMSAAQRTDGSFIVDVYYNVQDTDSALLTISLMVSSDGGTTWNVSCDQLSGDIGGNISPGSNKHITWNLGTEHPNIEANYHFKVIADDDYVPPVPEDFVFVPGGTFTMGDTRGAGLSNEQPIHSVTLGSFYISKYEINQAEWTAIMDGNPSFGYGIGTNYPVYYVSWYSVIKYCNLRSMNEGLTPVYIISGTTNPASWGAVPTSSNATWSAAICSWAANGYRLPTEAEWEYAARGASCTPDYLYSGSDDIEAVAWYDGNNTGGGYQVGPKPTGVLAHNLLGIYDLSGNLYEWCWDLYGVYSSAPQENPTGVAFGNLRVVRGGSWNYYASYCRVSDRGPISPSSSYSFIGFRLCRSNL